MEKYTNLRVIGEGSFGRAVLVQCKNSNEKYVVKEIQLPKNQSKQKNSRGEAILLSKMKHSNIVAFREAFEEEDLLCIVMEYCGGGDLLQRIQRQKKTQFCTENILKWFAQMCAGAKHIHDKRVLHRDLKSKNIFLTDDGSIKLGDFGSACILNSSKAHAHAYVGTPYYVAPEIWDNKPYNNKSDVWSLGCVLYELCTLRHPFQASSWKNLILKVCRGSYPPLPKHLPYELHYLIKQMFKTNPKDRPSVHTILTSHRVSRLLRSHLPAEAMQSGKEERKRSQWNRDEGKKVADFLGEKTLLKTTTLEGGDFNSSCSESSGQIQRKLWAKDPSDSVLQLLANASLVSPVHQTHTGSSQGDVFEETDVSRQRRRWSEDPPERLLRLFDKAPLNKAFSTFLILRGEENPLVGPLSQQRPGDDIDGPEPEVVVDDYRLQSRSDDEDTDFEEDAPCDWMGEVEKLFSDDRALLSSDSIKTSS